MTCRSIFKRWECGNSSSRLFTFSSRAQLAQNSTFQFWIYTSDGRLKSDEHMCLSATQVIHTNGEWAVQLKECAGYDNEHWDYNRRVGRL